MKKKKPRRVEVNNNLVRYNENCIDQIHYPESFEGIILSYSDRYPFDFKLYMDVKSIWDEHKASLRV